MSTISNLVEFDEVLLQQRELAGPPEDGAAVHVLALRLLHRLGPRLGREDALVAVALQLRQEEVVELLRLNLLQRNDVGAEEERGTFNTSTAFELITLTYL